MGFDILIISKALIILRNITKCHKDGKLNVLVHVIIQNVFLILISRINLGHQFKKKQTTITKKPNRYTYLITCNLKNNCSFFTNAASRYI